MQIAEILRQRLVNQHLEGPVCESAHDVVRQLGAVQAQDFGGSVWAVAQRAGNATVDDVATAFARGDILRTHVVRPTWHLVAAEDIRWLLDLTRPRLQQATAYYYRAAGLEAPELARAAEIIHRALEGGKQLTRTQLGAQLAAAHIDVRAGTRLAYIVGHAEVSGLICSGALQGKQHTYALLADRAPHAKPLDHDAALATLAERYFSSHGPATLEDYVWWSGLTKTDARAGLEAVKHHFTHETIEGVTYWFKPSAHTIATEPQAQLLPNYDEYIVAYTDRTALFNPEHTKHLDSRQNFVFNNVLILGGIVAGTWKKALTKTKVSIELNAFHTFRPEQAAAVRAAASRYAAHLQRQTWSIH